jgi:hypothetical protein
VSMFSFTMCAAHIAGKCALNNVTRVRSTARNTLHSVHQILSTFSENFVLSPQRRYQRLSNASNLYSIYFSYNIPDLIIF